MKRLNINNSVTSIPIISKDDEFVKWLDMVILFNDKNIFGNPDDDSQVKLLKQVKEKYLDIKKRCIVA